MNKINVSMSIFIMCCVIAFLSGCSSQPARMSAALSSFTNQTAEARSIRVHHCTYIVRCSDGSIWEVRTYPNAALAYKNCLFEGTKK